MHTGDKQHQKLLAEASKHGDLNEAVFCSICFRHTAHRSYGFRHLSPHNLLEHLVAKHGYSILPKPKHWCQLWR